MEKRSDERETMLSKPDGDNTPVDPSKKSTLESIMAEYLEQLEAGQAPDPSTYLESYPHHARELKSFFRNHHWLGETSAPGTPSLIGAQIGRYEIESEIARGGMGVVYRARQEGLKRPVALKLISGGVLAGREERNRFRIEAEAAAGLHHPGIIAIHDIGTWQGYEYFSMTLVDGPTLQEQVDSETFDDQKSARIVRDVALAVAYAHKAGIVHRDLKPENILISEDGRPLVADFGLAKWHRDGTMITRTGQVLGTPHYMSPEQACGRVESDIACDLYSLGAILYALLTGKPPHEGVSPAEVLRSVLQDEPAEPRLTRREISPDLEKICLKAIRYEPHLRYESAEALAEDLDRYLAGEPAQAAGSGLLDRVAREFRRDQHQSYFEDWGRALERIGFIILITHVAIFALDQLEYPGWIAHLIPRTLMMLAIAWTVYESREGAILPRSVAERPVWSIWVAYLSTLGILNLVILLDGQPPNLLFPVAAALSGFGFIAMAGHIWGGSAVFGLGFFAVTIISTWLPGQAPLWLGFMWFFSLYSLARHYRSNSS